MTSKMEETYKSITNIHVKMSAKNVLSLKIIMKSSFKQSR